MKLDEFKVGREFRCGSKRWLCTDVGSRVVVAVCLHASQDNDWFRDAKLSDDQESSMWSDGIDGSWLEGPPYAVKEHVFDENDIGGCTPGGRSDSAS